MPLALSGADNLALAALLASGAAVTLWLLLTFGPDYPQPLSVPAKVGITLVTGIVGGATIWITVRWIAGKL